MRWLRLLTLLASLTVAACAEPEMPEPILFQVPTQAPDPAGNKACMAALLIGTLVIDPRWGLAVAPADAPVMKVVWPNGYVGRHLDGVTELLDGRGHVVARAGDQIEVGGGIGAADDPTWFACG